MGGRLLCLVHMFLVLDYLMCEPEIPRTPLTSRTVRTKYGDVSGVIIAPESKHLEPVEVFRGIPYASPPLGSLRFMPPVTGALWQGVKIADSFSPVCPQRLPDIANETAALRRMPKGRLEYLKRLLPYLQNQSEDCLYLNIYAPAQAGTREGSSQAKYPVVVFIHGESYEWNSGNPYDGSVLASYGGVVVVTVNYRLGILGFLNANTDPYSKNPANYGLMDQIAALHWIQENIAFFGGDPTNVTLLGHGTGAACVNFLLTSSAVPEGGEAPHYTDYDSGAGTTGKTSKGEPQNAINILNSVLLRKSVISKLSRYDLLLGVVKAEAYFAFNGEDVQYGIEADRRTKILRTFVKNTYSYHLSEILATIVNEYTDWEKPVQHPINIRDETLEALSDAQFVAPVVHTADLHSAEHRNSYLYVFDYQTKFGDYQQRQGCIHGEELPYLFGAPLVGGFMHFGRNYTKSEVILSEITMIYWSNFARTGNPNEQQEIDHARQDKARFKNVEWTAYEAAHKKYLTLDQKPKLKNHYRAHRLSFWLNLVPDLHKPGGDDVPASHHELADDDEPLPKLPSLNPRKLPTTETPTELRTIFGNGSSILATAADSTERVEELGGISTTQHPIEDGFAAYSTALSVTIAIGCSLLILNVLIFAGVYYQRDKSRMNENGGHQPKKRNENGQMPNNICGDLESSIIGVKGDPATILGHHHSHHQLPPPEFADLPQNNATLPRHQKVSMRQENQPLLSTHSIQLINTGTLTKKNTQLNAKQTSTMEELRV
ncbi:neuroligin-4, Y-linked isoform X2 [Euwallacea similis]|uniref:neuroligin-4, Y-linked isoform X2 n=1 Tax=Euwallacea similis TaxID=1736056 RepID=UPI00344E598E